MNRFVMFLCAQLAMAGLVAETIQLTSTRELRIALERGEPVRMVVHYAKCRLRTAGRTAETAPDAVAGMAIGAFEYFAPGAIGNDKGFLAFSASTLIEHRTYGLVINYVRVRVFDNDAVEISVQYFKPRTHEPLMRETYSSSLHDGRTDTSAVYFYRK